MIQDGYYQSDTSSVIWWEGNCRGAYPSLQSAKKHRATDPSFCALPYHDFKDKWRLIEPIARVPQSTSAATGVKVEAPSPKPAGRRGQPAAERRRTLPML